MRWAFLWDYISIIYSNRNANADFINQKRRLSENLSHGWWRSVVTSGGQGICGVRTQVPKSPRSSCCRHRTGFVKSSTAGNWTHSCLLSAKWNMIDVDYSSSLFPSLTLFQLFFVGNYLRLLDAWCVVGLAVLVLVDAERFLRQMPEILWVVTQTYIHSNVSEVQIRNGHFYVSLL